MARRTMPDLTIPLCVAAAFVSVGWLIAYASPHYADAIRHTLSVFALAIGLLVMAGVTAKLHALLGVRRMTHRVEARSQVEQTGTVRPVKSGSPRPDP